MTDWLDDSVHQPVDLKNSALLEQIAKIVGEVNGAPISGNDVAAVIAAWHHVHTGDAVGTIRRDPETGAVAQRIEDNGLPIWQVTKPDGERSYDMQPTLPWPVMYEPG